MGWQPPLPLQAPPTSYPFILIGPRLPVHRASMPCLLASALRLLSCGATLRIRFTAHGKTKLSWSLAASLPAFAARRQGLEKQAGSALVAVVLDKHRPIMYTSRRPLLVRTPVLSFFIAPLSEVDPA